jgi:hypothetical protein
VRHKEQIMAVIQIVRFRLNDGMDEGAFRAVNERFQREVVPTLAGLLRREATRTPDGEWVLVLRYSLAIARPTSGCAHWRPSSRSATSTLMC